MRCGFGLATLALLIACAVSIGAHENAPPANSTPTAAEKANSTVDDLIKDLGSDDYRTREKAGRELAAKGEKILPALRTALSTTDNPEVHRRLLMMVRKLDFDRLVSPKCITMSLKDKTIKQAMDEISKQTGYKIEYAGNGMNGMGGTEGKHTFEFDNVPFWQVVDKVASAAGCMVYNDYNEDDTIHIYNQNATNPYVAYAGPFRFLATNINSNKNIQLSGLNRTGFNQNRQEFINLNFQIQSEPKNPMLGISTVDLITVTDDLGGSLIPPKDQHNRSNYYNNGMFRSHSTYGGLNLARNDKSATTIKTLKAKVGIILLSGTLPEIVINDPLKVQKKTFTGRTVEIEFGSLAEDANNKGHYSLDVTAKRLGVVENNQNDDFNWSNSIWQKIELVDASGNRYQSFFSNNQNNNGASLQLSIPFGPENRRGVATTKLGPPVKVLVNEWPTVTNEVTFEFKNVPLP